MQALEVRGLTKSFGAVDVLRGISFSADVGEFICLLGPSGCGKSTLLRCIAGLEAVTAGKITIDGKDMTNVPPAERNLAMVFQSYALYPHLNVRKNMGFGLSLQGMKRAEIDQRISEAARILEIGALLDRKPRQLSGGQRQRIALARALVKDPPILILDEATASFDPEGEIAFIDNARAVLEGRTVFLITHRPASLALADRVVRMERGGRFGEFPAVRSSERTLHELPRGGRFWQR